MISKHSHEQSDRGEGVEVVQNEPYEDPEHGQGQFTEKRVYLNRSLEQVLYSFIVEYLNNLCVQRPYTLLQRFLLFVLAQIPVSAFTEAGNYVESAELCFSEERRERRQREQREIIWASIQGV